MRHTQWTDSAKRERITTETLERLQSQGLLKLHERANDNPRIEITPEGKARKLFAINQ